MNPHTSVLCQPRATEAVPILSERAVSVGRMSRSPALSASRAKEYLQCPLKFRYSVVDGIRQPPTEATVKGTVVHKVLEDLFAAPNDARTPSNAVSMLPQAWDYVLERDSLAADLFVQQEKKNAAFADTETLVNNYFGLEKPENLNPKGLEKFVDARLPSGVLLRGIIDRIDQAPNGALRVIDYKTGKAPSPRFMNDALYQMRFYALLLREAWRLPARLQLLYLRTSDVLTLDPLARDIDAFEIEVNHLWEKISGDAQREQFHPRTSRLCDWCAYQADCPAFGGTVKPIPAEGLEKLLQVKQAS